MKNKLITLMGIILLSSSFIHASEDDMFDERDTFQEIRVGRKEAQLRDATELLFVMREKLKQKSFRHYWTYTQYSYDDRHERLDLLKKIELELEILQDLLNLENAK